MPGPTWTFDGKRYHDASTGRFVSGEQLLGLRDRFIELQRERVTTIAEQASLGDLTREQFIERMREQIKATYIAEYALGRGGAAQVTPSEWGKLGSMLKAQYKYLNRFADQIYASQQTDSPWSAEYIAARARMYINSATAAYERAQVRASGFPELPAYPGDGQTECLTNCKCHWDLNETETEYLATWTLGEAEHCDDCVDNAVKWAPLVITK